MRLISFFFLLTCFHGYAQTSLFNGSFTINEISGSAPSYTINGFFQAEGTYSGVDILPGDRVYFIYGSDCDYLEVDTIYYAYANLVSLGFNDPDTTFTSIPTGGGLMTRVTPNYNYSTPFTADVSDFLRKCVGGKLVSELDEIEGTTSLYADSIFLDTTGLTNISDTVLQVAIEQIDTALNNIQAQVDTLPTGSGTVNYVVRWTPDGNTLGNAGLMDNGSVLEFERPMLLRSYTTATLPTPATRMMVWNSDAANIGYYGGSAWEYPVKSSTGSGLFTAGSVLFADANGRAAQDNSNLFFDNTNNRFGVGLTDPSELVHIKSSTNGDVFQLLLENDFASSLQQTGIGFAPLRSGYTGVIPAGIIAQSAGSFFVDYLALGTAGSSQLTTANAQLFINRTNRIGILNSNPSYTLDVTGQINSTVGLSVLGKLMWTSDGTDVYNLGDEVGIGTNFATTKPDKELIIRTNKNNLYNNLPVSIYQEGDRNYLAGINFTVSENRTTSPTAAIYLDGNGLPGERWGTLVIANGRASSPDLSLANANIAIDEFGLVGIQTPTPTRSLDVNGELRVRDLTTDTPTLIVGADADGDLGAITIGSNLSLSSGVLSGTVSTPDTATVFATQYQIDTAKVNIRAARIAVFNNSSVDTLPYKSGDFNFISTWSSAFNDFSTSVLEATTDSTFTIKETGVYTFTLEGGVYDATWTSARLFQSYIDNVSGTFTGTTVAKPSMSGADEFSPTGYGNTFTIKVTSAPCEVGIRMGTNAVSQNIVLTSHSLTIKKEY